MYDSSTQTYIRGRALPKTFDIEVAKRVLLEHVFSLPNNETGELFSGSSLVTYVANQKGLFPSTDPGTPGYEALEDQISDARANLAAREALLSLHADSILLAYGEIMVQYGNSENIDVHIVIPNFDRDARYKVQLPSLHRAYRLAAKYREGQNYLLASDAIYISRLDQGNLPSRATRCLRECINAYKAGLYLSAAMTVGAASESLWMELCNEVHMNNPSTSNKLAKHLGRYAPSMSTVIKDTWEVLESQYQEAMNKTIGGKIEAGLFKEHADRLCQRRNYAMHNDDANEAEPLFTYNVTGMLLLESLPYFNHLMKLIKAVPTF